MKKNKKKKDSIFFSHFIPQLFKILLESSHISKITKNSRGAKYILGYKMQSKLIIIELYPRNSNAIKFTSMSSETPSFQKPMFNATSHQDRPHSYILQNILISS